MAVLHRRAAMYGNLDPNLPNHAIFLQASQICQDLIESITVSAMRYSNIQGDKCIALTVQDDDLPNLLTMLLSDTYTEGTKDPDYASQIRMAPIG